MAVRSLEFGFPTTVKTYASMATAEQKARKVADSLKGMVNIRIVPDCTLSDCDPRYTAIFYCFSEEGDRIIPASAGFMCHG